MQKPQTHDRFVAPSPRYAPCNQMSDNSAKVSNENKKLGRLAIAVGQGVFYRALARLPQQACQQRTRAVGRPAHGFRGGAQSNLMVCQ